MKQNDLWRYNKTIEIANAGSTFLPFSPLVGGTTPYTTMQILIAFEEGTGMGGGGHFIITDDTPNSGAVKISGSANCVAGASGANELGIWRANGTNNIQIRNNLGEARTVSIIAWYAD